jgi:hypothetical protein
MDSIDWPGIHHFETALYSPLFKGIKQKKRYTYPMNRPKNHGVMFHYDVALVFASSQEIRPSCLDCLYGRWRFFSYAVSNAYYPWHLFCHSLCQPV